MILAGLPATTENAGTSFVTTELAPIMAPSPMETPAKQWLYHQSIHCYQ